MTLWNRLSIRARITIGSLLVAVLISGVGLAALRYQVSSMLAASDVALAEADLDSYLADIAADPDETVDAPADGTLVYIRDPDGQVQVDTLPHAIHEAVEHEEGSSATVTVRADQVPFTVVSRTITTSEGEWSLWSARSGQARELALEGLDEVLLIGALILLALFTGASWLLSSAALRPVARMRQQAESLHANGNDRLPVGVAHDELSELAVTLNAFLDRVRTAAEREKHMVSDASHELRTPLAILKTQLELAHSDFGDAQALANQIIAAEASVERLASLAAGMLALSRLEAADGATGSSSADELVSELMNCVDRARTFAASGRVDVSHSVEVDDIDARFALVATDFGRLVDNLVVNAIAAVGASGAVRIDLHEYGTHIRLTVIDGGPGVPEAFIPVAFDRFTRADDSRAASTGGSGLGLALVRAIADSAGGSASLRNGYPGLIVTVELPKM